MANPTYQSGFYAPGRGTALHPELWDGCVGAWNPGLGNTGLVLRDWSGNQNNGVLTNGPTWGVSDGRQALSFDGSDDYVDLGVKSSLNIPRDITLTAWIRPLNISGRMAVVVDFNSIGILSQWGMEINHNTPGVVSFIHRSTSEVVLSSSSVLVANKWQHIAATRVGVSGNWTASLYHNGVLNASPTSSIDPSAQQIAAIGRFGGFTPTMIRFNGQIADTRIYNRALSANEIRTLAQRPGIAYERAPRKFYSLPAAATSRQYRLFRPSILRGA